jgi:AcrR family transcriptional regulator
MARMTGDELFRSTLPPGRHHLPRDFVERHQRARLFAAIVALVDEQGYPATSLTQIVKKAGVARHTFYEHFKDKEELFLAVFDAAVGRSLKATREAAEAADGAWDERMRAGVAALLGEMAKDPALARVCLVESQSAGLVAMERYEEAMRSFATMMREGRESDPRRAEMPSSMEDIIVGGAVWMIITRLANDPDTLEELSPSLVEFLLAPYLGTEAARAMRTRKG